MRLVESRFADTHGARGTRKLLLSTRRRFERGAGAASERSGSGGICRLPLGVSLKVDDIAHGEGMRSWRISGEIL